MNEVRKKQKKLYKIMKVLIIFSAVFIFVYIGAQPYAEDYSAELARALSYVCDALVLACLIYIFAYYSRYGKCEYLLASAEYEISDAGYYITSREETDRDDYLRAVADDLKDCGFTVEKNVTSGDFIFDVRAYKKKEFMYIVDVDSVDKNDVLAYLDEVINDITVNKLKRKGNAVLCFITDKAQDSAVELSKSVTSLGKKGAVKISTSVVEPESKKTFFRGNEESVCRRLTANYIMNCDIPIKEKYIHKEKLPWQYELENKLNKYTLKDFKDGDFYLH